MLIVPNNGIPLQKKIGHPSRQENGRPRDTAVPGQANYPPQVVADWLEYCWDYMSTSGGLIAVLKVL